MDEGDMAQDYQARHNAAAIAAHRTGRDNVRNCAQKGPQFCAWCEAEIPEARRRALPGTDLCVKCQAARERLAGEGRL